MRLLLVDDHPLVRDGLRVRLEAVAHLRVVAEAADAPAALRAVHEARPDLVLMDIGLRDTNGIVLTRQLLQVEPRLRVLVLSMHDSPAYRREALAAGASGYLLKDLPAEEIVQAIDAVIGGADAARWGASPPVPLGGPDAPGAAGAELTPRERDVLTLIGEGLSSRDISERLGMGVRTVETHRTHLRRKLGLPSAAALVRYAVEARHGTR